MTCEQCGAALAVGDWPWCPHGRPHTGKGFEPRFDYGLGQEVRGWGDIHKAMREHKLDFRDHPSKAQLADRREKIFERTGR